MSIQTRRVCAGFGTATACLGLVLLGCCIPGGGNVTPTASNQAAGVAAGGSVNITVVANDPDGGPNPLTYNLVTNPTKGTLGGILPNVTYTPNAGQTGCDQFTFRVFDGAATSNTATVSIAIDNQAPTATDVTVAAAANATTTLTLAGTDPDNCPPGLTAQIVTNPANGSLGTVNGLNVPYTPNTDFIGTDTFTYRVTDGLASSAATATATVNVAITGPTNRNVRLTLQNEITDRYIHYHMHLVAFREDVAVGDESRYESFGYVRKTGGVTFGCYTFSRDLFYYYHRNGRFRSDITNTSGPLLAGIAPAADASTPQLDPFFANREVPAPSLILFHDPQSTVPGEFLAGRSSGINASLDDVTNCFTCSLCAQASWYYVDVTDSPIGFSTACSGGRSAAAADIGRVGRYYRVPAETQDTVCWDCSSAIGLLPAIGTDTSAAHWLHNTAVLQAAWPNPAGSASNVRCFEYYLGGVITYTFTADGDNFPAGQVADPSLKWDVRTTSGQVIHSPS